MDDVSGENPSVEAMFDEALTLTTRECDKVFTSEEGKGKFVDMLSLYTDFINLKKIMKTNIIKADDYISYLQNFSKLKQIPLHLKDSSYISYIERVQQYLSDFVRKSQPLMDHAKFEQEISIL